MKSTKTKIQTLLLIILLIFCPILFCACGDIDDEDGNPSPSSYSNTLSGVKITKKANLIGTNLTNIYSPEYNQLLSIYNAISGISAEILYSLCGEYGMGVDDEVYNDRIFGSSTSPLGISADITPYYIAEDVVEPWKTDDTHYDAIRQDNWITNNLFDDRNYYANAINNSTYIEKYVGDLNQKNSLHIKLVRMIYSKLLAGNNEYDTYEKVLNATGGLSTDDVEQNDFLVLSQYIDHVGFTSKDCDAIAEIILSDIIGTETVNKDNQKYVDGNGNNTFDNNEMPDSVSGGSQYKVTVVDRNNTENRYEDALIATRYNSVEWKKINFVKNGGNRATSIYGERRKGVSEISGENYFDQRYVAQGAQAPIISNIINEVQVAKVSGFKNYVNTVFSIVYNVGNRTYDNEGVQTKIYQNIAGLTFKNYDNSVLSPDVSSDPDKFPMLPSAQYQSIIIMPKTEIDLMAVWVAFEVQPTELSEGEKYVTFRVSARYNGTVDGTRSRSLYEGEIGTMNCRPGDYDINAKDASDIMIDMGNNGAGSIFSSLGSKVRLNPFVDNANTTTDTLLIGSQYSKYFAVKPTSTNFKTKSEYKDNSTDFFEIIIEVISSHKKQINFGLAISPVVNRV